MQNKLNLFWNNVDIKQGGYIDPPVQYRLNKIGKLIDYWINEIPNHFNNVSIDEYIIMPDHIHMILIIKNNGVDISIRPYNINNKNSIVGVDRCVDPIKLGKIIQWFKIMSTNNYLRDLKINNYPKFNKHLWQRNYYEHIIRNEKEYLSIKQYIKNNPDGWVRGNLIMDF